MFIPGFGSLQTLFAAQFEATDTGYTYRKLSKGPAIKVTTQERSAFIKAFDLTLLCGLGLLVVGTISLILWAAFSASMAGEDVSKVRLSVGLVLLISAILGLHLWGWNAPAHALQDRAPSAPALSKAESTRRAFQQMPWINFPIGIAIFVGMFLKVTGGRDFLSGWNPVWLALTVAAVSFAVLQAYRKWRFEHHDKN